MRIITEVDHFNICAKRAVSGVGTFAKPGESQEKAIKRFVSGRKREWSRQQSRKFPTYKPGMSTAEYVRAYEATSPSQPGLKCSGFWADLNFEPATLYEGGAVDFAPVCELAESEPIAEPAPLPDAPCAIGNAYPSPDVDALPLSQVGPSAPQAAPPSGGSLKHPPAEAGVPPGVQMRQPDEPGGLPESGAVFVRQSDRWRAARAGLMLRRWRHWRGAAPPPVESAHIPPAEAGPGCTPWRAKDTMRWGLGIRPSSGGSLAQSAIKLERSHGDIACAQSHRLQRHLPECRAGPAIPAFRLARESALPICSETCKRHDGQKNCFSVLLWCCAGSQAARHRAD